MRRSTCITNMSSLTCKCEGIGTVCALCPAYTIGEPQQPPYQSMEQLRQMQQPSQNDIFGNKKISANLHAHAEGMFASGHLCTFIAMAVSAQSGQMEGRGGLHSHRPSCVAMLLSEFGDMVPMSGCLMIPMASTSCCCCFYYYDSYYSFRSHLVPTA